MCGIMGHIGPQGSVEIVLEGLKRLEYRGYDSAGVSFVDDKGILKNLKKKGKLQNLLNILENENTKSNIAIGHTRWATHGEVNDCNSHPHHFGAISLVHNGIIENADILREEMQQQGFQFLSETDSEVFLALISKNLDVNKNFKKAVINAFEKVEGNSAFVVLDSNTKEIVAIKKGAPLVCGINTSGSEVIVSSDPYALVGIADKLYFPEDNILCSLSGANKELLSFYDSDLNISKLYKAKNQDMHLDLSDKGNFDHYMLKEIYEQPGLIRALTNYYFTGDGAEELTKVSEWNPARIHISACGTAAYAGLVVRDFLEQLNRIPACVELGSEFRYRNPILGKDEIGLFISQSGETADTLAAQETCLENKLKTLSLVNIEGSTLFRNCDANLLIRAGIEIGVASTKAFTQQVLTGRLLSFALSDQYQSESARKSILEKFDLLAERIDDLLENVEIIKEIATEIYNKKGYFYTGRNVYFPIALEGALKLKEIAYVHAEGYAAGELKHGPIALIDEEMVNIAIVGPELLEKTLSNIQEIKARKGIIVTIGPAGNKQVEKVSDYLIPLNFEGLDELAPLYVNVANQLLAYYMAKFKGTDIDKPRNLAKSVTVE